MKWSRFNQTGLNDCIIFRGRKYNRVNFEEFNTNVLYNGVEYNVNYWVETPHGMLAIIYHPTDDFKAKAVLRSELELI